jgi:hypothetical protein
MSMDDSGLERLMNALRKPELHRLQMDTAHILSLLLQNGSDKSEFIFFHFHNVKRECCVFFFF